MDKSKILSMQNLLGKISEFPDINAHNEDLEAISLHIVRVFNRQNRVEVEPKIRSIIIYLRSIRELFVDDLSILSSVDNSIEMLFDILTRSAYLRNGGSCLDSRPDPLYESFQNLQGPVGPVESPIKLDPTDHKEML